MTVKYSRRRSEWESSVQCITLVLTIIVPYMLLVQPGCYRDSFLHNFSRLFRKNNRYSSEERPRTLSCKPGPLLGGPEDLVSRL